MPPVIGITGRLAMQEERHLDGIESSYVKAVAAADGLPVVLPVLEPDKAGAMARKLDGLLLTGGRDVEARRYGAVPVPEAESPEPERDEWEIALLVSALAARLPVLAICRGVQLLNVVKGGTLVQHLPSVSSLVHRQADRHMQFAHSVALEPGSMLASIVGSTELGVNSLHHQAVDRLGGGLTAVAWSDDGVVEAVEGRQVDRLIGVQWHPELLTGKKPHARLFTWLTTESARGQSFEERRSLMSPSADLESDGSPSSAVA
ncbi:MAG: gamma-glutamyl-gamma-aminobutyrate hydrolase family protein [Actinomycetota bacterium]|nr:gamma-glutamyl-gamma-aminobutyrate hydrolase family protein [Actinomycetota bacterium]